MGRRRAKNLLLDEAAVERGEAYCVGCGTTLSRLVEDFLTALPDGRESEVKSPIVRALAGVAALDPKPEAYRRYVADKYRERPPGTHPHAPIVGSVRLPHHQRTPIVIAPDVILDLIAARGEAGRDAAMLFDAIAAEVEAGTERMPAYIAPITVPMIHYLALHGSDTLDGLRVTFNLLRLLHVAPLGRDDYFEALHFSNCAYEDAIQFVACLRVGAKYLVTGEDFGTHRMPVPRRTAGEVVAVVGRG
jgi:hypothetical protein